MTPTTQIAQHQKDHRVLFYPKTLRALNLFIANIFLVILIFLTAQPTFSQSPSLRIGFMGDSGVDEYRGSDNRGGSYANSTFNWMEQLVRGRNIDAGKWGNWGEPRRLGYEYNWARSGATAQSLLQSGEHAGLAAQVADGLIDVVIISIGYNDFASYNANGYAPIYAGTLTDTQVTSKINLIIENYATAVDTILAARHIPMIVTTIGDISLSPLVLNDPRFSDPTKRQRVSNAITQTNAGITTMANTRGLSVFDTEKFTQGLFASANNGVLIIDGVNINLTTTGDEPHNISLGDKIHGGTILEGLLANQYLTLINPFFNPPIPLFTNSEILAAAGLVSLIPTPTTVPTNTPIPPTATMTNTPVPTSLPNAAPALNYFTVRQVKLTWNSVTWAAAYQVQISRDFKFTDIVYTSLELTDNGLFVTTPALENNTYFWHVRAKDSANKWSGWSTPDTFIVNAP